VRASQWNAAELARFDVLILTDGGNYAAQFGEAGIQRLKQWVQSGGTLIGLGSAVAFLSENRVDLLEIAQENALREEEEKKPAASATASGERVPGTHIATEADFEKLIRASAEPPDSSPGVIARARLRPDHWLTAGAGESVNVMVAGREIWAPIKADKGVNAAYFEAVDKLLASGYLWSENRKQLAFKPLLVVQNSGRGLVVGFTADPNFRAMQDGMNVLFLNAVFRGPAHTGSASTEQ
jgi:hypothetical protein